MPARILNSKAVSREIEFASRELMDNFRVEQAVLLHEAVIERWNFTLGFVIPDSTNTWQTTIVAAENGEMIPAAVLSYELGFVVFVVWECACVL